jgi:hypothetical protein
MGRVGAELALKRQAMLQAVEGLVDGNNQRHEFSPKPLGGQPNSGGFGGYGFMVSAEGLEPSTP